MAFTHDLKDPGAARNLVIIVPSRDWFLPLGLQRNTKIAISLRASPIPNTDGERAEGHRLARISRFSGQSTQRFRRNGGVPRGCRASFVSSPHWSVRLSGAPLSAIIRRRNCEVFMRFGAVAF